MDRRITEEVNWRIRVFDSLSFPTLVLKPDRTILSANEIFLEKYGRLHKIVGKTCHEVFYGSKEPCSRDICPLPGVIADKKGRSTLTRVRGEDGQERWEDRVFSPILNDDGEVLYILESVRDVTPYKTLERTLKETEVFLEKVIQSSASAIVSADRSGEILFMNRAAEDLFGYSPGEAVRKLNIEALYPPGKAREIMSKLRDENLGGRGKLPGTRTSILNSSQEEVPVRMTASIIYEGDKEVATMGIFDDLREKLAVEKKLRETQAQLIQSDKMASLGQLAAGVAHELNNPLTGILFYSNLILESLDEESPIREDLGYVVEDVYRCKDIVKNLLAYSRETSPSRTIVQINSLVEQSLGLIRDQSLFARVRVVKEMSDEMMLVNTDQDQLCQVIINLILNAVAAMKQEGTLTFRTYRDKKAGKVSLEVIDTGCGISSENLPKVFDPFFTTKEPGKGTGLGLSTSYGIVKEHGGDIRIKNTSPEGTTFLLELPLFQPSDDPESLMTDKDEMES